MVQFSLQQVHKIPELDSELHCFTSSLGMQHYHLANRDKHRCSSLAFRTHVSDNTGVAHVLEHSVLCGSERYPVRDPFFMMIRRSMQTFMNAMTGSDCTWYPFATQNEQDFYNLFSVYADAVFMPRLHELDIAQESHRWELIENDQLQLNGVVYNEMKGDCSDPDSILYHSICRHLLNDTSYAFNSGGDPLDIPDLTTEQVRQFHRDHYHHANGCLCTYGDINVETLHQILAQYTQEGTPPDSTLLQSSQVQAHVTQAIPSESTEDLGHVICAYRWGDAADPMLSCIGDVIEELLLGHAAAPMRLALESSGLCHSSDGSSYVEYCRNGLFFFEAHGVQAKDYQAVKDIIADTIQSICVNGFKQDDISRAIKQLSLHERYIDGDRQPHGLQLCEQLIDAWNYQQDPLRYLDTIASYKQLEFELEENPHYLIRIFNEYFNKHASFVYVESKNNPQYHQILEESEQTRIQRLTQSQNFNVNTIKQQQDQLALRQQEIDDENILPKLSLDEIDDQRVYLPYQEDHLDCMSNGLQYQLHKYHGNYSSIEELLTLRTFSDCIGQLGYKSLNYKRAAIKIQEQFGRFVGSCDFWFTEQEKLQSILCIDTWGLEDEANSMSSFTAEYINHMSCHEDERIKELLQQRYNRIRERLISNGSNFAVLSALAQQSPYARIRNALYGIPQLAHIKHDLKTLPILQEKLHKTQETFSQQTPHTHSFGKRSLKNKQTVFTITENSIQQTQAIDDSSAFQAFPIPSNVQFCAMSLPVVHYTHADAPVLYILGFLLSNVYLHTAIREAGGAYGVNAYYSAASCGFVVSTYRDPQLDKSFEAIHKSLDDCQRNTFSKQQIEEAIISAVAEFDKPDSPFTEARKSVFLHLKQESISSWQDYRKQVINCTQEDITRVAQLYFTDSFIDQHASYAVLGAQASIDASQFNWQINNVLQ